MLHPAFARSRNGFLCGVYPATQTITQKSHPKHFYIASNQFGRYNTPQQDMLDTLNIRVEGGSAAGPWHCMSIYELRLISDLICAELLVQRVVDSQRLNEFNWRGFNPIFGLSLYTLYSGITFQSTEDRRIGVRLSSPQGGDGFYSIPLDLPMGVGNATEIVRGHHAG